MKLILFLVSIYSLIFYQHYKMKNPNAFVAASKVYIKKEIVNQRSVVPGNYGDRISSLFIRNSWSGNRESLPMEFAVRQ